jgi:zinc and cadmium transporter
MPEYNTFMWVAVFAVSAAVVNGIGILAVFRNKSWVEKTKTYLMCFAAGILLSSPLISALPQALVKNSYAGFAALAGFLFMMFSNEIIKWKTKQKSLAFGITALEGIGIHSFVDGIIYTVTFSTSLAIGFLSGFGLVVHEFAEGVITFSVLRKGQVEEKKAAFIAFLVASMTTPVGAFIAYPLVNNLRDSHLGLALGFVSGVLIYVSASHLLPEARGHEKKHSILSFLAGVFLALIIVFSKII